jgi:hypothetical protein
VVAISIYWCLAALIGYYIHLFVPVTSVTVNTSFRRMGCLFNMVLLGIVVLLSLP